MAGLHATISKLAERFVEELLAAVSRASLEEVAATPPPAARNPARAAKRAARRRLDAGQAKAISPERLSQIVGFVLAHPGCRAGEVRDALGLSRPAALRALQGAVAEGSIVMSGKRGGARYRPAGTKRKHAA